MATVAEILAQENARGERSVLLFRDGLFWRAYEMSAYILARHTDLKPQKKFFKAVNTDVVFVGFPDGSWQKFTGITTTPADGVSQLRLNVKDNDVSGFPDWRAQVKTKEQIEAERLQAMTERQMSDYVKRQRQRAEVRKLTKELPVYQVCYDLLKYFIGIAEKIDRPTRYLAAQKVEDILMQIAVMTRSAQRASDKQRKIEIIDSAVQLRLKAEIYLRLLYDLKKISLKKFALCASQLADLEKHLENWKKYYKANPGNQNTDNHNN